MLTRLYTRKLFFSSKANKFCFHLITPFCILSQGIPVLFSVPLFLSPLPFLSLAESSHPTVYSSVSFIFLIFYVSFLVKIQIHLFYLSNFPTFKFYFFWFVPSHLQQFLCTSPLVCKTPKSLQHSFSNTFLTPHPSFLSLKGHKCSTSVFSYTSVFLTTPSQKHFLDYFQQIIFIF